jgi:dihydrofolate reductase
MGKVFTHMTMSLDGYIADPDDQAGELFDWYQAGEVSVASANEDIAFDVDEASAEALRELTENAGALVSGRRLFDIANGWNDSHPSGAPVVVVTHSAPANAAERWPRTTFVDGVEAAIAKARKIAVPGSGQPPQTPRAPRAGPGRRRGPRRADVPRGDRRKADRSADRRPLQSARQLRGLARASSGGAANARASSGVIAADEDTLRLDPSIQPTIEQDPGRRIKLG